MQMARPNHKVKFGSLFQFRISPTMEEALHQYAERNDMTASNVLRLAIAEITGCMDVPLRHRKRQLEA
jgi:hypothetical protein